MSGSPKVSKLLHMLKCLLSQASAFAKKQSQLIVSWPLGQKTHWVTLGQSLFLSLTFYRVGVGIECEGSLYGHLGLCMVTSFLGGRVEQKCIK